MRGREAKQRPPRTPPVVVQRSGKKKVPHIVERNASRSSIYGCTTTGTTTAISNGIRHRYHNFITSGPPDRQEAQEEHEAAEG